MKIKSCFLLVIFLTIFAKCSKKNIEIEIIRLSKKVNETSGLELVDGNFLTLNDSGDEPYLYTFDREGKILSKILIKGAQNRDWESLASDEKYIYIGDIGNNKGNRKDLTTEVYALTKNPGNYSVEPGNSFNVDALITGGDYNSKLDLLALVGYSYSIKKQYLFLFKKFSHRTSKNLFFKKHVIPITNAQIEAIKIIDNNNFWLSSENEGGGYPKLVKLNLK